MSGTRISLPRGPRRVIALALAASTLALVTAAAASLNVTSQKLTVKDQSGVVVSEPARQTRTTTAWDVRDASGGGSEVNNSDVISFAEGNFLETANNISSTFGTQYWEMQYPAPLMPGLSVTGAQFNMTFTSKDNSISVCIYLETRKVSDNSLIASHGSAASPLFCTANNNTLQSMTEALPEVSTTSIANDLRVKVFARVSSGGHKVRLDAATVTGTPSLSPAFTLYPATFVDASGTATTTPWSLYAADTSPATAALGPFYSSANNWASTFSSTRYLKFTFPAYVPSAATVTGATFNHVYRDGDKNGTVCYYFEVLNGSTVLGTHPAAGAGAPICSAFGDPPGFVTATPVSLPELNTPAKANAAIVKMYMTRSGKKTEHDLVSLTFNYFVQ